MLIFKVLKNDEYTKLRDNKLSKGSNADLRDGYIHFSTKKQLNETLKLHFQGEKSLILMAINTQILGDGLVWEMARNKKLFPHFYGRLEFNKALWFAPLELQGDKYVWPSGFENEV